MTLRLIITAERAPSLAGTFVGVSINMIRRAARAVGYALCGLRGHDDVLHFEPARLSLRCLKCGRQTPGWTLDVKPRAAGQRLAFPRAA